MSDKPEPRIDEQGRPWCETYCRHYAFNDDYNDCLILESAIDLPAICEPAVCEMAEEIERLRDIVKAEAAAENRAAHVEGLMSTIAELRAVDYYQVDGEEEMRSLCEVGDYSEVGDVIQVRPMHWLSMRYVAITEAGPLFFDTQAEADEAAEATESEAG